MCPKNALLACYSSQHPSNISKIASTSPKSAFDFLRRALRWFRRSAASSKAFKLRALGCDRRYFISDLSFLISPSAARSLISNSPVCLVASSQARCCLAAWLFSPRSLSANLASLSPFARSRSASCDRASSNSSLSDSSWRSLRLLPPPTRPSVARSRLL